MVPLMMVAHCVISFISEVTSITPRKICAIFQVKKMHVTSHTVSKTSLTKLYSNLQTLFVSFPVHRYICRTPVLGIGLGVDFTFALDNIDNNDNDNNNPHLIFLKWTAGIRVNIFTRTSKTQFGHNFFLTRWVGGPQNIFGPKNSSQHTKFFFDSKFFRLKLIVKLQVLGLRLGVDFTFTLDNNHNHNNHNNPRLNFFKRTALGVKEQGLGIRDKG